MPDLDGSDTRRILFVEQGLEPAVVSDADPIRAGRAPSGPRSVVHFDALLYQPCRMACLFKSRDEPVALPHHSVANRFAGSAVGRADTNLVSSYRAVQ